MNLALCWPVIEGVCLMCLHPNSAYLLATYTKATCATVGDDVRRVELGALKPHL